MEQPPTRGVPLAHLNNHKLGCMPLLDSNKPQVFSADVLGHMSVV